VYSFNTERAKVSRKKKRRVVAASSRYFTSKGGLGNRGRRRIKDSIITSIVDLGRDWLTERGKRKSDHLKKA